MRHLGVKLTHDAAVSYVVDGELVFSTELEKIDNNARHTPVTSFDQVDAILEDEAVTPGDLDTVTVDGWKHGRLHRPTTLDVAPYHDGDSRDGDPDPWSSLIRDYAVRRPVPLIPGGPALMSYTHVTGHIIGAYAMSPVSVDRTPAYVLVWDGGVNARLYLVNPNSGNPVAFVGHVHRLYGMIYGVMGYYYGPYKSAPEPGVPAFGRRDWPGKLMSWIALGQPREGILKRLRYRYESLEMAEQQRPRYEQDYYNQNGIMEHALVRGIVDYPDADVLASIHQFLEDLLVERTVRMVPAGAHLIFTGGSALNIKWNSALRETGHFGSVFVPPVANDSGSALGQACTRMALDEDRWSLRWSVFAGPYIKVGNYVEGWRPVPCPLARLASVLAVGDPVVVLYERAEIGPRALGARSILMLPSRADGRDRLNQLKWREPWRPVAPVVLESAAPQYFVPGTPDPYMLFDHTVHKAYRDDFPAIVHLDGTARLQTANAETNPLMAELLTRLTEIGLPPVLCNTSANLNGSGFFPDAESAMRWGGTNFVWLNGTLYVRGDQHHELR
jgi:carbamoyltransferase